MQVSVCTVGGCSCVCSFLTCWWGVLTSVCLSVCLSSSAVQLGFGWTNGVALQLLDQYGAALTSASSSGHISGCLSFLSPVLSALLLLLL